MQEQDADPVNEAPGGGSVLQELLFIASTVSIGLVLAFMLLKHLIIPVMGFPGDLDRIAKLGDRLSVVDDDRSRVEIVSNSVGVEGISASIIEEQLGPGYAVRNQSSNGLDILSGRLYISRVLASQPEVLIWILRPEVMGEPRPVIPEVASVMRWAGFVEHAPWVQDEGLESGVRDEILDRLSASERENLITLRTLPLRVLNDEARSRMRKGILKAKTLETDAPYQMEIELSGTKLDRHIEDVTDSYRERAGDGNRRGLELIERTIIQIRESSVLPVIVIAPTHPDASEFRDADRVFSAAMSDIAERTDAIMIDLTGSLPAEGFADAMHPNRPGTSELSEKIGAALRGTLETREQE